MKIFNCFIIALGALLFGSLLLSGLLPGNQLCTHLWGTLLGLYLVLILITLIYGIIEFCRGIIIQKKLQWISFVPFVLAFIFLVVTIFLGVNLYETISNKQFENKFLSFDQLIKKIQLGEIEQMPGTAKTWAGYTFIEIPPHFPSSSILTKNEKGTLIVIFQTGGTFPNSRGGYLYISDDNPPDFNHQYQLRKIRPYWYRWYG